MTGTLSTPVTLDDDLLTFEPPEGVAGIALDGGALQANVSSIVSVASVDFTFQENSNTPGRFLEQSVVVNRPPGTGFFVGMNVIRHSFTSSNFANLTERPLGQLFAGVGLRGQNVLVCQARLTDSNSDDPIDIRIRAFIVFFN
jgi:hypothetical protein